MRGWIIAVATAASAQFAWAAPGDRPPLEIRRPTAEQELAARPPRQAGFGGAVFYCAVALNGSLEDCEVAQEVPAGAGEAMRKLLPLYLFSPAHLSGRDVVAHTLVSVVLPPDDYFPGQLIGTGPDPALVKKLRPQGTIGNDQKVAVSCLESAKGELSNCKGFMEPPKDNLLVAAAIEVAKQSKAGPARLRGASITVPINLVVDFGEDLEARPNFGPRLNWAAMPNLMPPGAKVRGLDAHATINCKVSESGSPFGCVVVNERPEGGDMGISSLGIARGMNFTPARRNGRPVAGEVEFVIGYSTDGTPSERTLSGGRVVLNPLWVTAPSFSQVAAAFPEVAKGKASSGQVILNCVVGKTGALGRCAVVEEQPRNMGFRDSAMSLAPAFRADMTPEMMATGRTLLRFHFFDQTDPGWTRRRLNGPRWRELPDQDFLAQVFPADAKAGGLNSGRASVTCTVGIGGALAACTSYQEQPEGFGFGPAAIALAQRFKLNPWTDDGFPVDGIRFSLPVVMNLPAPNAPAAAP